MSHHHDHSFSKAYHFVVALIPMLIGLAYSLYSFSEGRQAFSTFMFLLFLLTTFASYRLLRMMDDLHNSEKG